MPKVEPTLLGTVQDVSGATVSVALSDDSASGLSFIEGHAYRVGQVGSFVRIPAGYTELFGVVTTVGAGAVPESLRDIQPFGYRWLTLQLVGESVRGEQFERGIAQFPTIGDPVHLVAERDLERLYGSQNAPECIRIGHIANADSIPALVNVDKLVTRHSAVVGTTGSGKSTTVIQILDALVDADRFPSARVLVFDIHGEYKNALPDSSHVLAANRDPWDLSSPLYTPYWAMSIDELLPLTFGPLDGAERSAVQDKIVSLKRDALETTARRGVDQESVTVDSPVPFSIHELWFHFHRLLNATHNTTGTGQSIDPSNSTECFALDADGNKVEAGDAFKVVPPIYQPQLAGNIYLSASPLNLRRPVDNLASRLRDKRLQFLFTPGEWSCAEDGKVTSDLDKLLQDWLASEEPISIFDLSGIPPSILQSLIGALMRIVYDALFWGRRLAEGARERPLLLVLEEAHAYLNKGSDGLASQSARRILREGRKYGVGAMVVSQRPSEIDSTVLSQCGTLFALRLSNATDRGHVSGAVSDNFGAFLDSLAVLRTGEAIVLGEGVHLPMRMIVPPLPAERRADSHDPLVYDARGAGGWNRQREPIDFSDLVETWRSQNATPSRVINDGNGEQVEREPVVSSNLVSVGYDQGASVLEVEFRGGSVYQYFDVPQPEFEGLMAADSKGSYLNTNIKGVFRYARV